MRKYLCAFAFMLVATQASAGEHKCSDEFCFQPQAKLACVKPELWGILNRLAEKVGKLELTAGCNGRHARGSYHYKGMAVDFRPLEASQKTAMDVLREDPEVGGVISEGHGLVHVDIGDRGHGKFVAWKSHRHYAALGVYGRGHHRTHYASR